MGEGRADSREVLAGKPPGPAGWWGNEDRREKGTGVLDHYDGVPKRGGRGREGRMENQ